MNDMDASNNISSVKTIMAAQSDLSNNILLTADNATGTGMFIIGKRAEQELPHFGHKKQRAVKRISL